MYTAWFDCLTAVFPWLLVVAAPYFYCIDRTMRDPLDGYWHFGRLLLCRTNIDLGQVWQLHLGWLVKLFFLPLMFGYTGDNLTKIVHFDFTRLFDDFRTFYDFSYNFLFYVDLLFVTAGYACTLRLFDSHIRSTEPTFLGWAMALICYQPFWSLFYQQYLLYDSGPSWGAWLWSYQVLAAFWGAGILVLLAVYAWASMAFGIRFSNLTHRGILTNGPYRYTRHPAYIAKNLSWWMIAMPFMIDSSFGETAKQIFLLLLVNCIYILRARTEERHLAADPIYVAYAEYIDRHGLFAWLGNIVPMFRFKGGGLWGDGRPPRREPAG